MILIVISKVFSPDNKSIQRLVRIIVSIGEAMQYDSSLINNKIFDLLQLIIASDTIYQQMSQSKLFFHQFQLFNPILFFL